MAFAPYVTRSVGGNLLLNDGVTYRCDKPEEGGVGGVVWSRQTAKSSFMHGEALVGATKAISSLNMRVLVGGASQAQANANVDTLIDAFSQFSYEVHLVDDGIDYAWKCQPADFGADLRWLFYNDLGGHYCPVNLVIPRHPVPIAGPF